MPSKKRRTCRSYTDSATGGYKAISSTASNILQAAAVATRKRALDGEWLVASMQPEPDLVSDCSESPLEKQAGGQYAH